MTMRMAANLIHCRSVEDAEKLFKNCIVMFATFPTQEEITTCRDKLMNYEIVDTFLNNINYNVKF